LLQQNTTCRQEIEEKKKELRKLVGTRYRNLIDAADSIIAMRELSSELMRVEKSIDENHIILSNSRRSQSLKSSARPINNNNNNNNEKEQNRRLKLEVGKKIKILMDTPEAVFQLSLFLLFFIVIFIFIFIVFFIFRFGLQLKKTIMKRQQHYIYKLKKFIKILTKLVLILQN
jgi:hypothetical protein